MDTIQGKENTGATAPEECIITPDEKARLLAGAIMDKKGEEIVLLDVSDLVDYADRFVIATGTNPVHLQAMTDEIQRAASRAGQRPLGVEGNSRSSWILLDYGEVLVHLFLPDSRGQYDLDGLWSDAAREDLSPDAEAASLAR